MTSQPPPGSDRRDPLSFDELIALFVAFSAIGAILWWSLGRGNDWLARSGFWTGREEAAQSAANNPPDQVAVEPTTSVSPAPAEQVVPVPVTPGSTTIITTDSSQVVVENGAVAPGVTPQTGVGTQAGVGPQTTVIPAPVVVPAPSPEASIVVPSASPAAVAFPDVPSDYWAYPFIAGLSQRGMISGFSGGEFRPDQPVTRTEYAALIEKILPDAQQATIGFNDVPPGFWGTQAIDQSVKAGFLKGYPDATFQPEQPISRMQVLLSLVNGFQLPKPADPDAAIQRFQDRDQIPDWAKPAVGAATQSGVVVNHPNLDQFNPNQPATRAEVAAMLYQALTTTGQVQPVQSDYIVRP